MAFLAAADIGVDDTLATEVCIVGAGAAGLTMARALDDAGVSTVVLEAGGFAPQREIEHDTFGYDVLGAALDNPIPDRGRQFGGSTSLWFGRVTPPTALDFETRSWVPNSGWPMLVDDLEPWMRTATDILGVDHADQLSIDAWEASPAIDALRCAGRTDLGVFLWANQSDVGTSTRSAMAVSRHVRVVTDATVTSLSVDEADCVDRVEVQGPGGREFTVTADRVVLAAGGLENPRLLLASRSRYPAGVGNHHDNVGRYYIDHPRGEGLARVDVRNLSPQQVEMLRLLHEKADGPYGASQLRVVFDEALQREEGLLNHAAHGYLVSKGQQSTGHHRYTEFRSKLRQRRFNNAREFVTDAGRLAMASGDVAALAVRRVLGRDLPTDFVLIDQLEQVPDRESRVVVDGRRADRFGLPRLQIDWKIDAATVRSHRRLHEVFRDTMQASGIFTFESRLLADPDFEPRYLDMKHPSGTTRMSESPKSGVVDSNGRVHGTKNLFVSGSSTFPTSGHFNPTLTIVALAARLADHLIALRSS